MCDDSRLAIQQVHSNIDAGYGKWALVSLREALAAAEGCTVAELKDKYQKAEDLESRLEEFVLGDPGKVVRTARVAPKDINESCAASLRRAGACRAGVQRERSGKTDNVLPEWRATDLLLGEGQGNGWWMGDREAASTIWDDLLSNNLHKEGSGYLPNGKKPEALIKRILEMTTQRETGCWIRLPGRHDWRCCSQDASSVDYGRWGTTATAILHLAFAA